MKKLLLLLVFVTTIYSCSNPDITLENNIIGKWKLIEVKFPKIAKISPPKSSIDYSHKNIIYNFQANNILIVSGGNNEGYSNGNYDFYYGEDHLSTIDNPKVFLVKINESKWTYNLTNEKMILGKSYVDGPDLVFEKR